MEEGRTMSKFKIASLRWLAPVALVGAVGLAACGDEDATEGSRTAGFPGVAGVVGSDQHLRNQAEAITDRYVGAVLGSDQHLENQANEIATRNTGSLGSDQHLHNQANEVATGVTGSALGSDQHLHNQAVELREDTTAGTGSESGPNVFEAGNRAVERYMAVQQDQAGAAGEFVSGTRHMPR
jgi:hypothetical protein